MSAELRELCGRVAAQERVMASLSVGIEEVTDQLQETTATMATKEDIKLLPESFDNGFNRLSESFDNGFNRIDSMLADIQANVGDIRNILATLVGRLEQK